MITYIKHFSSAPLMMGSFTQTDEPVMDDVDSEQV